MIICEKHLEDGKEIDYTAWYKEENGYLPKYGRLSLRKRDGKYELYVKWHRTNEETVLFATEDLAKAVAKGNEIMHRLGYTAWADTVGEC